MLEAEVNFMHDLDSLIDLVEFLLRDFTRRLYDTRVAQEIFTAKRTGEPGQNEDGGESADLQQRWKAIMDGSRWPRITYTRAVELLQDAVANHGASFIYPPTWSEGLQLEHEKYLVDRVFPGQPVFVTDYPKQVKPFYMLPSEAATANNTSSSSSPGETVACFDLLLPVVSEVVGGSLREHRLPNLIQSMREYGLIKQTTSSSSSPYPYLHSNEDLGHLRWYADLRRWGSAPHGGFGLGFDRLLGYLAGVSSVRDVVPFPRYFGRADC